jgi:hypothetical protein
MSKFIECWRYSNIKDQSCYINTDKIVRFEIGTNENHNFCYIKVFLEIESNILPTLPFQTKKFKSSTDDCNDDFVEAYKEAESYLKNYIEELNK